MRQLDLVEPQCIGRISRLAVASGARSCGTGILPVDARHGTWARCPCHSRHHHAPQRIGPSLVSLGTLSELVVHCSPGHRRPPAAEVGAPRCAASAGRRARPTGLAFDNSHFITLVDCRGFILALEEQHRFSIDEELRGGVIGRTGQYSTNGLFEITLHFV